MRIQKKGKKIQTDLIETKPTKLIKNPQTFTLSPLPHPQPRPPFLALPNRHSVPAVRHRAQATDDESQPAPAVDTRQTTATPCSLGSTLLYPCGPTTPNCGRLPPPVVRAVHRQSPATSTATCLLLSQA